MEAPNLIQQLKAENTVEIPIPGHEEKAAFRKLTLYDLAAAGFIPLEIFTTPNLTEAQSAQLRLSHLKKMLADPHIAEVEEAAIAIVLTRTSIANPKIVGVVKDATSEITVASLGNLARYFFQRLMEASGMAEAAPEAAVAAPFRDEVRSDTGRGGAKVRRAPKRAPAK